MQIGSSGVWRISNGANEIMADTNNTIDWQDESGLAFTRRVTLCTSGSC